MGMFSFGTLDIAAKVDDFERILIGIRDNLEKLIELHTPAPMEPPPVPIVRDTRAVKVGRREGP